jgi:hypothetical protein
MIREQKGQRKGSPNGYVRHLVDNRLLARMMMEQLNEMKEKARASKEAALEQKAA